MKIYSVIYLLFNKYKMNIKSREFIPIPNNNVNITWFLMIREEMFSGRCVYEAVDGGPRTS